MELFGVFLLSCLALGEAQTNFGYMECRKTDYKAKCIGKYVSLTRENYGLKTFPEITKSQACIRLKRNAISKFPDDLKSLAHVVTLDLAENKLSTLPNNLHTMERLEILDLSNNRISTLSSNTRFPVSLRGFLLAGNGISSIPSGFQVPGLFVLDLSKNRFTDIPEQFCVSNQLIRVDFTQNPLNKDVSHYMGSLNKCRNKHNVPFCLFTDHNDIQCDCSVMESLVFGRPSFLLGTSANMYQEMSCSVDGSSSNFTGRSLYDLDTENIDLGCKIALKRSASNNSAANRVACSRTVIGLILVALYAIWL